MVVAKEFSLHLFILRQLYEVSALPALFADDARPRHPPACLDKWGLVGGETRNTNDETSFAGGTAHHLWPHADVLLFAASAADPPSGGGGVDSARATGPWLILL